MQYVQCGSMLIYDMDDCALPAIHSIDIKESTGLAAFLRQLSTNFCHFPSRIQCSGFRFGRILGLGGGG